MKAYFDIVTKILTEGVKKKNKRTGQEVFSISGTLFEHNLQDGFPLLTTKFVPFRLIASELEFFIKGITNKQWLQERNNHIWDEWCNPKIVPYGHDEQTKEAMKNESDLGPIYGWQWRHFGDKYIDYKTEYNSGIDQLKVLINKIKIDPTDRRLIVSAWNPLDMDKMALPPCHYGFQVLISDGKLDLLWNQRSVDVALGLPFNIASYALLLHLLALETGFEAGKLVGFLADVHIYFNHMQNIMVQLEREFFELPKLVIEDFGSIFDWTYSQAKVINYNYHPKINFEIVV